MQFKKLHEPKFSKGKLTKAQRGSGTASSLGDDHNQDDSKAGGRGLLLGCILLWVVILIIVVAMVMCALYFSGVFGPVPAYPPPPPVYPSTYR